MPAVSDRSNKLKSGHAINGDTEESVDQQEKGGQVNIKSAEDLNEKNAENQRIFTHGVEEPTEEEKKDFLKGKMKSEKQSGDSKKLNAEYENLQAVLDNPEKTRDPIEKDSDESKKIEDCQKAEMGAKRMAEESAEEKKSYQDSNHIKETVNTGQTFKEGSERKADQQGNDDSDNIAMPENKNSNHTNVSDDDHKDKKSMEDRKQNCQVEENAKCEKESDVASNMTHSGRNINEPNTNMKDDESAASSTEGVAHIDKQPMEENKNSVSPNLSASHTVKEPIEENKNAASSNLDPSHTVIEHMQEKNNRSDQENTERFYDAKENIDNEDVNESSERKLQGETVHGVFEKLRECLDKEEIAIAKMRQYLDEQDNPKVNEIHPMEESAEKVQSNYKIEQASHHGNESIKLDEQNEAVNSVGNKDGTERKAESLEHIHDKTHHPNEPKEAGDNKLNQNCSDERPETSANDHNTTLCPNKQEEAEKNQANKDCSGQTTEPFGNVHDIISDMRNYVDKEEEARIGDSDKIKAQEEKKAKMESIINETSKHTKSKDAREHQEQAEEKNEVEDTEAKKSESGVKEHKKKVKAENDHTSEGTITQKKSAIHGLNEENDMHESDEKPKSTKVAGHGVIEPSEEKNDAIDETNETADEIVKMSDTQGVNEPTKEKNEKIHVYGEKVEEDSDENETDKEKEKREKKGFMRNMRDMLSTKD